MELLHFPVVFLQVLLDTPVSPSLTSHPAHPLPEVTLANGSGISLIDHTGDHECRDENPNVSALHGLPPPSLNTHLPQAVHADAGAIQEDVASMTTLDPRPETGEEAAEEEALRSEDVAGQVGLEEADGRPSGRYGACDKGGSSKGLDQDTVKTGHGRVVEALELEYHGEG